LKYQNTTDNGDHPLFSITTLLGILPDLEYGNSKYKPVYNSNQRFGAITDLYNGVEQVKRARAGKIICME
jgi:hypothetical protein